MTDTHTTAHIPDEAVKAALEQIHAYDYVPDENDFSNMKDAIKSALSYLSAPCAVEVTKLEWTLFNSEKSIWIAESPLGLQSRYAESAAAAQADFERRILSCITTKPVDVAAVRRQAFEEGFENGVEQSLNVLDSYDDITRNEAEQSIRKLKPDYRALSAEPVQGDHFSHVSNMVEALKETRIDLVVISGNIADAAKSSDKWEGMYDRVRSWIDRIDAALPAAPNPEAGK